MKSTLCFYRKRFTGHDIIPTDGEPAKVQEPTEGDSGADDETAHTAPPATPAVSDRTPAQTPQQPEEQKSDSPPSDPASPVDLLQKSSLGYYDV